MASNLTSSKNPDYGGWAEEETNCSDVGEIKMISKMELISLD